MTAFDRVTAALDTAGIPCALIGAAALAAHGVARSTYDIDLLVVDPAALDEATWAALRAAAVAVEIRRGDAEDPLAGVVRCEWPGERPVEVIVGRHRWQGRAIDRAIRPAGATPVVQRVDLILLKLYAGGTQDLWDVQQLLAVSEDAEALAAGVDADVRRLPPECQQLWTRLRGGRG